MMKTITAILMLFFSVANAQWIQPSTHVPIEINAIAIDGSKVFASGGVSGFLRSTDNGTSWTVIYPTYSMKSLLSLGSSLYGVTGTGTVLVSNDGGNSWTQASTDGSLSSTSATTSICYCSGLLFVGGGLYSNKNGVYRSSNGGSHWTFSNSGLPFPISQVGKDGSTILTFGCLSMVAADTVIYLGSNEGVYRSTDYGVTWTNFSNGLPFDGVGYSEILHMAISDSLLIAAVSNLDGSKGIYTCISSIGSWAASNNGLSDYRIESLAANGSIILAGGDGGSVFLSTDRGSQWNAVNSGLQNNSVHALGISATRAFAGTWGGSIYWRNLSGVPSTSTSLTFDNRVKGDSMTVTAFLRNTSINAMTIINVTTNTPTFVATTASSTVIAGDSTQLMVKFKPTAFGTFTDTVTIISDGGTAKVALSGTCPTPILTSLKTSIVYGNVLKGATKKDSVKIVNSSINTLVVDSIYTKTSLFTVDKISGTVGTDTLSLNVTFTSTTIGPFIDTMYLRNNSTTPLVKIPLSGNIPAPVLGVSTTSLAFSNRVKGDSATMTAYLKNTSINSMTISGITTGTNTFSATSGSTTVVGGDSIVLTVKFKPIAFGPFTDTVKVVSDGGTLKIAVSGSSPIPTITSLKTSIAFSNIAKNTTNKDTVKITNSSINTLTVDSIYTKTSAFTVNRINGTVGTDTLKVVVSFTPTAIASYTDTLYLRNNSVTPLVKVPLSGNCTTGVEDVATEIPDVYSLAQNYPNPFNPSTTLRYGLPSRSTVRLVIYNVLGQVVKELVNTEQQAGIQSVLWNAKVSSGIYFYKLEAVSTENPSKRFVETKKMLLLK